MTTRRPWTKAEENYLIDNLNFLTDADIAEQLNRTVHAIAARRRDLNVKRRKIPPTNTLCAYCDNARADRCRWARYGNPDKGIDGWVVVPTVVGGDKNAIHSVRVEYCPQFRRARNAG